MHRLSDERGFTLPELLVAITILAIVLAGTYQGLSSLQVTSAGVQERFQNLDEARVLMATITKDVRTATRLTPDTSPFVRGEDRRVTFYANIDTTTGPNRVDIRVDSTNRLVEEVVAPSGAGPVYTYTSPATVRVVGSFIANTGPLFTYLDDANDPIPTPLDATELKQVAAIDLVISIRKTSRLPTQATTIVNRVRLPNVDYNPLVVP